jgi:hypothetical protein
LSYKQQNQNSKFSVHLQDCRRSIGRMDEIMEVVQDVTKGSFMNVLRKILYLWRNMEY